MVSKQKNKVEETREHNNVRNIRTQAPSRENPDIAKAIQNAAKLKKAKERLEHAHSGTQVVSKTESNNNNQPLNFSLENLDAEKYKQLQETKTLESANESSEMGVKKDIESNTPLHSFSIQTLDRMKKEREFQVDSSADIMHDGDVKHSPQDLTITNNNDVKPIKERDLLRLPLSDGDVDQSKMMTSSVNVFD